MVFRPFRLFDRVQGLHSRFLNVFESLINLSPQKETQWPNALFYKTRNISEAKAEQKQVGRSHRVVWSLATSPHLCFSRITYESFVSRSLPPPLFDISISYHLCMLTTILRPSSVRCGKRKKKKKKNSSFWNLQKKTKQKQTKTLLFINRVCMAALIHFHPIQILVSLCTSVC